MEKVTAITYLLCPKCQRTVPAAAKERYCPNDGVRMLAACPHCQASINSPYSRFCTSCGEKLLETLPHFIDPDLPEQTLIKAGGKMI